MMMQPPMHGGGAPSTMSRIRDRLAEGENLPIRVYADASPDTPLERVPIDGTTWFQATGNGSVAAASAFLLGGVSVNVADSENQGCTAMHYCAASGDTLMARLLLDNGAKINQPNSTGVTPLMVALQQGRVDMCIFLVERGADITPVDDAQEPTLFYGATKPLALNAVVSRMGNKLSSLRNAKGQSALHLAAATPGARIAVLYLVEQGGCDVDAKDNFGDTALHFACRCNDIDNIKALMSKNANHNIANNDGILPASCSQCTHGSLISKIASTSSTTQKEKLTQVDASNWANLDMEQIRHFFVPFILPNVVCYIASFLPAFFSVLALGACGAGFALVAQFALKQRRRSISTAGFFSGALVFGSYLLITRIFPLYEKHYADLEQPVYIITVWWIVTPIMYFNYGRAILADPGAVPSSVEGRKEIYDLVGKHGESEIQRSQFDVTTMVKKPLRAKHCSKTHHTVYRFDHFCVWTGNAIGGGNHRAFVWYCLSQTISQLCVLYMTCSVLFSFKRREMNVNPGSLMEWSDWLWSPTNQLITQFLLCYNTFVILFVSAVIFSQLWYATRNVTSNEVWFAQRYRWMTVLGSRAYSYYDVGLLGNLKDFFITGNLCKEEHTVPPMSEHLIKATREFAAKVKSQAASGCGSGCNHDHGGGDHGHSHGGHGHSHDHGGHGHSHDHGGHGHSHGGGDEGPFADPQRDALAKLFEATSQALDIKPNSPAAVAQATSLQTGVSPSSQLEAAARALPPETQNEMQIVQAMLQNLIQGGEPSSPGLDSFPAHKQNQMVHQARTMHQHYTQAMTMMQGMQSQPASPATPAAPAPPPASPVVNRKHE